MAKPLKYPVRRHFNHDTETDALLVEKSKALDLTPAQYIRVLVNWSLTDPAGGLMRNYPERPKQ